MMEFLQKHRERIVYVLLGVFFCTSIGLWFMLNNQDQAYAALENRLQLFTDNFYAERATATAALALKEETVSQLSTELDDTKETLEETEEELEETEDDYRDEKKKNDEFEEEYREVINTVYDLEKLSKTDEELLQKYSKVSFLNEHFIPEDLTEIPNKWKYSESRQNSFHSKALPFLEEMLEDALDDGVEIWVVSAYRSFEYQEQLKTRYTVIYGSGANAFSADQGFSEHQLGTAADFTTRGLNGELTESFANTEAYEWLVDNAHKYGFTLSYPEGNAFYVFEPWHWRFVGTELADDLDDDNAYFYDWDQRDIDQYLLNIFD